MNEAKKDPYATAEESESVMAKNISMERREAIRHVYQKMDALGCWEAGTTAEFVARKAQEVAVNLAEQRDELLEALKKCKFDSLNMTFHEMRFIRSTIKKAEDSKK